MTEKAPDFPELNLQAVRLYICIYTRLLLEGDDHT